MAARCGHAVVTGGAGFLGSHLCDRLLARGFRVTCVDSYATSGPDNIERLRDHPAFKFVEHDVTESFPDLGEAGLVLHLASAASPRDYARLPIETLRAGSLGTANALDVAARHGARFLLTSTSEVYGDPLEHPQPETYWGNVNPVGPRSVYDEAKRYAEALTMAHRRQLGADVAIARIFNTYGPRMRRDDGRMIPNFLARALAGEPLPVTGTGEQTRSVCYVDDTISGLLALAESDLTGPVNIGNPEELSVRHVAEEVVRVTGSRSRIVSVPGVEDDPSRRCPDISLAREKLGWNPGTSLDEGLRLTITGGHPS